MQVKKGDKVKILSGKDKGKTGKILQVFRGEKKASVEGINLLIKHMRPKRQGEKGQRIEFPAPLSTSKLMVVCPKCGKPARIGMKIRESASKKKKSRICIRCKEVIDQ